MYSQVAKKKKKKAEPPICVKRGGTGFWEAEKPSPAHSIVLEQPGWARQGGPGLGPSPDVLQEGPSLLIAYTLLLSRPHLPVFTLMGA